MKRLKTKKFKKHEDLIKHAIKNVINRPPVSKKQKLQKAVERLRTH